MTNIVYSEHHRSNQAAFDELLTSADEHHAMIITLGHLQNRLIECFKWQAEIDAFAQRNQDAEADSEYYEIFNTSTPLIEADIDEVHNAVAELGQEDIWQSMLLQAEKYIR